MIIYTFEYHREKRHSMVSYSTTASCITEIRGSSKIENGGKSENDLESVEKYLEPIASEVTKLQKICSLIETDFMSTKNDMGNLQVQNTIIAKK